MCQLQTLMHLRKSVVPSPLLKLFQIQCSLVASRYRSRSKSSDIRHLTLNRSHATLSLSSQPAGTVLHRTAPSQGFTSFKNSNIKIFFHTSCVYEFEQDFTMGRKKGGQRNNKGVAVQNNTNDHRGSGFPAKQTTIQRNERFKKLQNTLKVPAFINIVVVGTGGPGTSQSLLVTTENSRYMFNCGEGTQRLAAMSKGLRAAAFAKLAGLEHIFITHKSWENTGGLLGMAMTLEGQKNPDAKMYMTRNGAPKSEGGQSRPKITIHGPPDVEKIALMAKKFSESANMHIVKAEGEYQDAAFTITPVPFYREMPITSESSSANEGDDESAAPPKKKRRTSSSEVSTPGNNVAYAYICQAKPPLPKINVEKCLDAGITIGPMVGKLQRGESVVLDDGRVVHPSQVTDMPPTDDRPFLIIECPSVEFLPSLASCSQLQAFTTSSHSKTFAIIVHMTPAHVFNTPEYQAWMQSFHKSTDHLVMNREANEADLIRVRDHQARLNLVSEDVFPLLPEFSTHVRLDKQADERDDASVQLAPDVSQKIGQIVKACSGLHFVYRGKGLGFQIELDEFKCKELQDSYVGIPEIQEQLEALRQTVPRAYESSKAESDDEESLTKYPKVVFLGTGSSEPNRIRAQSCIVVQLSKHSVILLDCGEDSYGQLYRFYGKAKASRILRKVKAFFVSHLHADHHLGLFSLLKERKNAFDEKNIPFVPTLLLAPIQMRRWLRFYQTELEPVTHLFRFVQHQQDLEAFDDGIPLEVATFDDIQSELNLTEYKPVEVKHCQNAFGVTFKHANGFKLVYSGDTRPCERLVIAGENADLLIHEATHEDSLLQNAKASKHSTFSEAMEVGEKMKAKNIILTHFSQRYPHMVPFFNMTLPQNVGIAFDNMQVCPSTMKDLGKMIPVLTSLFADELQRLELKNIKRIREQGEAEAKQASENR